MNIWQDSNNVPKELTGDDFIETMITRYTPNELLLLKNRRGGNKTYAEIIDKLYERNSKGSIQPPCEGRD